MRSVVIPYTPRPHFVSFHKRSTRWAVLVCHRRAGKTVATVNDTIRRAVVENKKDGRYAIIFPLRTQAKDTAWQYLKYFSRPVQITEPSESELMVRLASGAMVRLYGSDNPDALRGPFVTWYTLMIKASTSGILPQEELSDMLEDMGEDLYEQEMECSFESAIKGAFYSKEMRTMLAEGRIRAMRIEPAVRMHTGWDLGRADATAIWFLQSVGNERRLVDYYEGSNIDLEHYVQVLIEKRVLGKFEYGTHHFPHDLAVTELMAKESRKAFMERNLGASKVNVVPQHAILDGIGVTRKFLGKAVIDPNRCFRGLEAFRQYRREWNVDRKDFGTGPYHDWTSHGADAGRILAIGYEEAKLPSPSKKTSNADKSSSWAA